MCRMVHGGRMLGDHNIVPCSVLAQLSYGACQFGTGHAAGDKLPAGVWEGRDVEGRIVEGRVVEGRVVEGRVVEEGQSCGRRAEL